MSEYERGYRMGCKDADLGLGYHPNIGAPPKCTPYPGPIPPSPVPSHSGLQNPNAMLEYGLKRDWWLNEELDCIEYLQGYNAGYNSFEKTGK